MICRAQSQQGKAARVPFGYCAIGGIDGAMPSIIAPDPNGAIHELPLPPTAECSELRQLAQIAKQFARSARRVFFPPGPTAGWSAGGGARGHTIQLPWPWYRPAASIS